VALVQKAREQEAKASGRLGVGGEIRQAREPDSERARMREKIIKRHVENAQDAFRRM